MDAFRLIVAGMRSPLFILGIIFLSQTDSQQSKWPGQERHYDRRIYSSGYPADEDSEESEQTGRPARYPTVATAGRTAISVAGRTEKCGNNVRVSLDSRMEYDGLAQGNRIVLNPRALSQYPEPVQLFIFYHECAHIHIGADEVGADCWAVHRAVQEAWLDEETIQGICESFGPDMGTSPDGHPGSRQRCLLVRACYTRALAMYAPVRPNPSAPDRQLATVQPPAPTTARSDSRIPQNMQHFLLGVK